MMRRARWTVALLFAFGSAAQAQQVSPPKGAVAPLAFMLGTWQGDAWIDMGPSGRHTLRQQEWITSAAGGTVLVVVGQGLERLPDGSDKLMHDAFATIYGSREGKPAFRAFIANGNWIDPEFEPQESGYTWSFTDPRAGRIRYSATFTGDRWVEFGEREAGGSWVKFFEMTLHRVGS